MTDFWTYYLSIGFFYAFIGKPLMHYAEHRQGIFAAARVKIAETGQEWTWLHDLLFIGVVLLVTIFWPVSVLATIVRVAKQSK